MSLKRLLGPSNRRARIAVGIFLALLFCIQCTRTQADKAPSKFVTAISGQACGQTSAEALSEIEQLARTDHTALLRYCLDHYSRNYRDYTCTFIKQERLGGTLGEEQWINVKFRDCPFSVAMQWTRNAPIGDRVLFVEGKYGGRMLVQPKGLLANLVGTVARDPDGPDAMRNTLRPVNLFGFRRGLQSLIDVYEQARRCGDLREEFGGYAELFGRRTLVLVRYLPAKEGYPAYKTTTYIDTDYLVPVAIEGLDWQEQLSSRYYYKDICFNTALDDEDFLPASNGMTEPKK